MAAISPSGSAHGRRNRKQDARQNIDMVAEAIGRNQHFNVCYLNPDEAAKAARALARVAVRTLHGRRIEPSR